MPNWDQFAQYIFFALIAGVGGYATKVLASLVEETKRLNQSVGEILVHLNYHKEELTQHDQRLNRLETSRIPKNGAAL